MASRPFRILGLQQVALGGLSKPRLSALWHGLLGVPKLGHYRSTAENVDEDILQLGRGPLAVELDLMEPIDPTRAPKVHQPALNHIGLWVDPLRAAVDHLQVPPLEKGSRVGLMWVREFRESSERLQRDFRETSKRAPSEFRPGDRVQAICRSSRASCTSLTLHMPDLHRRRGYASHPVGSA